jgi:hypothetical protein
MRISSILPQRPRSPNLPKEIAGVSQVFVTVYGQASWAEQNGNTEIAGVGYRKALEFLIKDYLIRKYPDKENTIKRTLLGTCIRTYADDTRIKTVAERAVWLGNDETHYERLWEGKDISDLKRLINLTVNWIVMEIETETALSEMPDPRGN